MFHQREIVRIGEPETVAAWRDAWRDRALELLRGLGLDADFDVATDPFFGRSGRMLAASQREQALKFEILVQIAGPEPTAVASFNYHQDHFAETLRDRAGRRRRGAHRLPRLRPRADRAGAAAHPRPRPRRVAGRRCARSSGLR